MRAGGYDVEGGKVLVGVFFLLVVWVWFVMVMLVGVVCDGCGLVMWVCFCRLK